MMWGEGGREVEASSGRRRKQGRDFIMREMK